MSSFSRTYPRAEQSKNSVQSLCMVVYWLVRWVVNGLFAWIVGWGCLDGKTVN